MNGDTSMWKLSLTCSNCSKIFKDPVELPCEDFICKEHLEEKDVLKQNKITCVECKQHFEVKGNTFKTVKLIQKQLDNKVYLNNEEKSLKQNIEETIHILNKMYEEFNMSKTGLDLDVHNHFQEVRLQIDMHREKLKEKIDDIYMEMIDKTKDFEAKYLNSLNEKLSASLKFFKGNKSSEEALEMTELTFRDPNLLIEPIRKLKIKQQEIIETLKTKLNEMNQIKENMKASIDFKPNLSFEKDAFGSLYLIDFPNNGPFNSKILTFEQSLELMELCEFNLKEKFNLLYRGSQDGFTGNDFHLKCDGQANTLTILKAKNSEFIFGGFTTVTWESGAHHKSDPNSFIFSLTNKDNKPCKINTSDAEHSIGCWSRYGPIFGSGDIRLGTNLITNEWDLDTESYSDLGNTYEHSQYACGTNEAKSFLAGSYEFELSEIEVYERK